MLPGPRGTIGGDWLVHKWRQRGLLSEGEVSPAELADTIAGSWFVRRNRRTPNTRPDPVQDDTWLSRRNRLGTRAKSTAAVKSRSHTHSLWQASIQGRLPSPGASPRITPAASPSRLRPPTLACERRRGFADALADASAAAGLGAAAASGSDSRVEVYLTVYDLCPCWNCPAHALGVGVYHSGIELPGVRGAHDVTIPPRTHTPSEPPSAPCPTKPGLTP